MVNVKNVIQLKILKNKDKIYDDANIEMIDIIKIDIEAYFQEIGYELERLTVNNFGDKTSKNPNVEVLLKFLDIDYMFRCYGPLWLFQSGNFVDMIWTASSMKSEKFLNYEYVLGANASPCAVVCMFYQGKAKLMELVTSFYGSKKKKVDS